MLYDILPKWALAAIVIGIVLLSIMAEYLIQRKDKQIFSEFGIRRRTRRTMKKHPVGTMLHETML